MHRSIPLATAMLSLSLFAACGGMSRSAAPADGRMAGAGMPAAGMASDRMASGAMNQSALPEAVRVPAGQKVTMETVGVGEITYECRAKVGGPMQFEWFFVGPEAPLMARAGQKVGRYFGPPATWQANDGSAVTGTQVAVAPAGAGNIPLQLVRANPATGQGAMNGVGYIQRLATKGGVPPAMPCGSANLGKREVVKYQADYIFWAPQ